MSQEAKAAPETLRLQIQNTENIKGTFVIFCLGDQIEVKARGLKRRQLIKLLGVIISKIF
jgi:hypothetical protein